MPLDDAQDSLNILLLLIRHRFISETECGSDLASK